MSRCRREPRSEPVFIQDKQYFARYSPEGFKQCKRYSAYFNPGGNGRPWRQEKSYCARFGRPFED